MRALLTHLACLRKPGYLGFAVAFLCAAGLGSPSWATALLHAQAAPLQPNVAQTGRPGAASKPYAPLPKPPVKRPTKPLWSELTPAQQQALTPLAGTWDTVSEAQKRKWLAMSQNFPMLSAAEQATLRSRMTEWVALSPQQRTQARLNFGQTQQLAPDDKKAKWEAYQALSPEEKRKLAAKAPKAPAAAAAVKPVAPEKLAGVPKAKSRPHTGSARIAAAPNQVDHNTLLPQPAPAPAPLN
ncbi:MAG: hypothetical protein JWP43_1399 [Ramlibacter sp.]|jgi:hypothetical protein|nr:hypothetical protein [Ramlibacter sp.]